MSCCYQEVSVRYRRGSTLRHTLRQSIQGMQEEGLCWDSHCINPFRVCRRGSTLGRTLRQPIQGMQERLYVGTHTASTHQGYAGEAGRTLRQPIRVCEFHCTKS
ncbi:hypothetical protein ElyMa_003964700 [Elysia marginata]|uniref:Uncharacterized protein n=1 Tax=Elysia marginata TaxID=1093978 RepID=A0AAV4FVP5_9GAST|nr:hypothetical protein ElyMa_003964700 [Elysia marginata]